MVSVPAILACLVGVRAVSDRLMFYATNGELCATHSISCAECEAISPLCEYRSLPNNEFACYRHTSRRSIRDAQESTCTSDTQDTTHVFSPQDESRRGSQDSTSEEPANPEEPVNQELAEGESPTVSDTTEDSPTSASQGDSEDSSDSSTIALITIASVAGVALAAVAVVQLRKYYIRRSIGY